MHTKCWSSANLEPNLCVKFALRFSKCLKIAWKSREGWKNFLSTGAGGILLIRSITVCVFEVRNNFTLNCKWRSLLQEEGTTLLLNNYTVNKRLFGLLLKVNNAINLRGSNFKIKQLWHMDVKFRENFQPWYQLPSYTKTCFIALKIIKHMLVNTALQNLK